MNFKLDLTEAEVAVVIKSLLELTIREGLITFNKVQDQVEKQRIEQNKGAK